MRFTGKLGKKAAKPAKAPPFSAFAAAISLPPAPPFITWSAAVKAWPMMGNDVLGDCTCAAAGHMVECWSTWTGDPFTPTDRQIVAAYSAVSGYDPATGANDDGAAMTDVLDLWRSSGIGGHKIGAWWTLDPADLDHARWGCVLSGATYIGLQLPVSAQGQAVWDVPPGGPVGAGAPGSWGGHAVPVVAYDASHAVCVSWGGLIPMTWSFFRTYCDEAYVAISPDWQTPSGMTPVGLDGAAVTRLLNGIAV